MANKFFLGILIISSFVSNILAADPQCSSGWEPYKKNCIKIVKELIPYKDAKSACNGVSLLTIHSEEEQNFITNFLFKNNSIVENIWLGLEKKGDSFEWSDKTKLDYAKWSTGMPSKIPDRDCVQLLADSNPPGNWSDSPCNKKNYYVCQGPPLTLDLLQTMISESLKPFKNYLNYLMNAHWMKLEFFENTDGKQKAFIIPSESFLIPKNWNEAVKLCNDLKAEIVDMDSPQKKLLLLSYLTKLGSAQKITSFFIWLNGQVDSNGKVKWKSGSQKNVELVWMDHEPNVTATEEKSLAMSIKPNTFSKISNIPKTQPNHVICEMLVNF